MFDPAAPPQWATAGWYRDRDRAPHLEQDGHRERLTLAADMVADAVAADARTVCDLGAGDGGLLSLLTVPCWGYDLQSANVSAAAGRGVAVSLRDVVTEGFDPADCVVATEFLEHLVDPHGMSRAVHRSGAKWMVASSPYTETADSHYDYHLWAWDQAGYAAMLTGAGWRIVRQGTAWICQVVLCEAT